ncbi:DMT family transporter [Granulosicoccus sp. 3-233]|uniref:DMT family transporter n=1 Tax=Granulosicoccus sp. 3-233 TaxID=3417969 RepID=UPI003D3454C1
MSQSDAAVSDSMNNWQASLWLLSDMCLNLTALGIIKLIGTDVPAAQLVFIRALTGLVLMLPWVWRERSRFIRIEHKGLQLTRVLLAMTALTASYFAVARLPLALFTAINFTRPLLLMVMAAWLLRESIPASRWVFALIGLVGVLIAVNPGTVQWSWGIPALFLTVLSSTLSTIATRRLRGTPAVVTMLLYTAGLSLLSLPLVVGNWQVIPGEQLIPILCIGVLAQCGQFCFLKAHWLGEASVLGPLGYANLLLAGLVGFVVFNEIPTIEMILGSLIIILATAALSLTGRR